MDIWQQGAQAARAGLSLLDCPFYRAANMPGHTGESIREWQFKVKSWEAGWQSVADTWNTALPRSPRSTSAPPDEGST
ncbi:MAG TPA: CrpP-related protein [Bordetella sp.]|nr:CrpP-related protein [Bordetella sp.]